MASSRSPALSPAGRGILRAAPATPKNTARLRVGQSRRRLVNMFLDQLVAHGTYFEETFCFLVQALAVIAVKRSLLQNAEHSLGPEIIFVVETVHSAEDIVRRQSGILDVCQLVAAIVDHLFVLHHEAVADCI